MFPTCETRQIEFKVWPKFVVLWFKMFFTDQNKILHTSFQYNCRDMYKNLLWLVKYILKWITSSFCRIMNSIEILLVRWVPGQMHLQNETIDQMKQTATIPNMPQHNCGLEDQAWKWYSGCINKLGENVEYGISWYIT